MSDSTCQIQDLPLGADVESESAVPPSLHLNATTDRIPAASLPGSPVVLNDRPGSGLVLIAVVMTLIFVFLAFTVDTEYLWTIKCELQSAANEAAAASAAGLASGTEAAMRAAGASIADKKAGGVPVDFGRNIEVGEWDANLQSFTLNSKNANAVRVTARVKTERLVFAPVFGCRGAALQAQAIGVRNAAGKVIVIDDFDR